MLVLVLLPGTQGLYGFIVTVMMLMNIGVLGGSADHVPDQGAAVSDGFPCHRRRGPPVRHSAGAGRRVRYLPDGPKPNDFSKALVSTTLVEIYALLAFLVSLLSVINIAGMTNI